LLLHNIVTVQRALR